MRVRRVFVEAPLAGRTEVTLDGGAARHVSKVLRLGVGDALRVFDGRGGEYAATICQLRKDSARVSLHAYIEDRTEPTMQIALWQGVAKGERMDFTVQKATELGVVSIVPVFTRRSVVRLSGQRSRRRLLHWQALAASAAEQSGRTRVPEMSAPASLEERLRTDRGDGLDLVLDPTAAVSLAALRSDPPGRLTLLAGPEGGLDPDERDLAVAAGFRPVRLGPRILRTETAAIVALSIVQSLWGDLQ